MFYIIFDRSSHLQKFLCVLASTLKKPFYFAVFDDPFPRPDLRMEARKSICDTWLLLVSQVELTACL